MSRRLVKRLADSCNHSRYTPASRQGHYESWFMRANHPSQPRAFWIRYTIFAPRDKPDAAIGELWAIVFDGTTGQNTAVKRELPITRCRFGRDTFAVTIGEARLGPGRLVGSAGDSATSIHWNLAYQGSEPPLFNLPPRLYEGGFPKAKALVSKPLAVFQGALTVSGERLEVDGWVGSQNHNWGERHTDHYAWGQVAGFESASDTFIELATARLKLGPLWTPFMTPCVVRHAGREYLLNALLTSFRRARFRYFEWDFRARSSSVSISGRISAPREAFVCLRYGNPPGGFKYCLNTKIARCELTVTPRGQAPVVLVSPSGAAFEILTSDADHGMQPVV